jgi:hypothetical protein
MAAIRAALRAVLEPHARAGRRRAEEDDALFI